MNRLMMQTAVALALSVGTAHAQWQYQTETDKMTGKEARYAMIESSNSLSLDFPYRGKNHGQLTIRQHPKYGLDVIVSVEKGQILCRSYDGCTVSVKFDSAPPVRFSANGAADHDPKVIFLDNEQRFIASAQKAKRVLVQVAMFQSGEQVLEFVTPEPLQWGASAAKKK